MSSATEKTLYFFLFLIICSAEEDNHGVDEPTVCEVCKFLAIELQSRLQETGKSKEVIETGHGLDVTKKKKKYHVSELRLIEALSEPHICDRILNYNVHKEKKGSSRFAKGRSQTMEALHGLVAKGVKVDLGMPYEMWDKPPAEITQMKRKCEDIVEEYEEEIEQWYYNHQDKNLLDYLCRDLVLKSKDKTCLNENLELPASEGKENDNNNENLKGDRASKTEL